MVLCDNDSGAWVKQCVCNTVCISSFKGSQRGGRGTATRTQKRAGATLKNFFIQIPEFPKN